MSPCLSVLCAEAGKSVCVFVQEYNLSHFFCGFNELLCWHSSFMLTETLEWNVVLSVIHFTVVAERRKLML